MGIDYSTPVLVVDDEFVIVTLVKQLLSKIGFEEVHHATDGEMALKMLKERTYQLVLSDLHMKPIDGLQLLRAIRENETLKGRRRQLTSGVLQGCANRIDRGGTGELIRRGVGIRSVRFGEQHRATRTAGMGAQLTFAASQNRMLMSYRRRAVAEP